MKQLWGIYYTSDPYEPSGLAAVFATKEEAERVKAEHIKRYPDEEYRWKEEPNSQFAPSLFIEGILVTTPDKFDVKTISYEQN